MKKMNGPAVQKKKKKEGKRAVMHLGTSWLTKKMISMMANSNNRCGVFCKRDLYNVRYPSCSSSTRLLSPGRH